MQDISDKELDQFFKDSTENPVVFFDENAWNKLEQSLDQHQKRIQQKKYRSYGIITVTFLLLSIGYSDITRRTSEQHAFYQSTLQKKSPERESLATASPFTSTRSGMSSNHLIEENGELQKSLLNHNNLLSSNPEDHLHKKEKTSTQTKDINQLLSYSSTSVVRSALHKKHFFSNSQNKSRDQDVRNSLAGNLNTEQTATNNSSFLLLSDAAAILSEPQQQTSSLPQGSINDQAAGKNQISDVLDTDNLPTNNVADTLHKTEKPTVSQTRVQSKDSLLPKEKTLRFRRFSFGVFASPDFSFTSSMHFVSPGISEGIFGEYHANNHWSFFVGVMRSSKVYASNNTDYQATDKYWAYKSKTNRIDGSCAVIDVPINVKYHFYHRSNHLLFASAGISSYFMLHEKYSFIYTDGSPEKSWSYNERENYFFSLVNLSVGYEHYLNKFFSLQVEPFVKVPVNTIGDGEIKLLTTGMFVYLKYTLH
jgi:hypothetical protein